jgi:hypothetical protein
MYYAEWLIVMLDGKELIKLSNRWQFLACVAVVGGEANKTRYSLNKSRLAGRPAPILPAKLL